MTWWAAEVFRDEGPDIELDDDLDFFFYLEGTGLHVNRWWEWRDSEWVPFDPAPHRTAFEDRQRNRPALNYAWLLTVEGPTGPLPWGRYVSQESAQVAADALAPLRTKVVRS